MALSNENNPLAEKPTKAAKPEVVAPAAGEEFALLATAARALQPAAESSNPEVHRLLAERRPALRAGNAAAIAAIDAQLAALGVAV